MVKVETEKPKKEFEIVTKGNTSHYYEFENGKWLLKKVWTNANHEKGCV